MVSVSQLIFMADHISLADPYCFRLLTSIASKTITAVPSSSVVTVIMILTSCDIPADAVALLLAIEWFLKSADIHGGSYFTGRPILFQVVDKYCFHGYPGSA